jgi:hypothetical protein
MAIEDFLYEEVKECDADFDFYVLYMQTECDDPYYPPYNRDVGMFKSKENAIKRARDSFYKMAKGCITAEDRKYGGVESMFYVEGGYFHDSEASNVDGEKNKKRKGMGSDILVYIIYDKEEQKRVETRWEKMHGKMK